MAVGAGGVRAVAGGGAGVKERVLAEARAAKERLSAEESVLVEIPFIDGTRHMSVAVRRAEFEELASPWIARTIVHARQAVRDAGMEPAELDAVILVGAARGYRRCGGRWRSGSGGSPTRARIRTRR